jgi:hypothetical protein
MALKLDGVIAELKAIREHNEAKGTAEVRIIDGALETSDQLFADEETQAKISAIDTFDPNLVFIHIKR